MDTGRTAGTKAGNPTPLPSCRRRRGPWRASTIRRPLYPLALLGQTPRPSRSGHRPHSRAEMAPETAELYWQPLLREAPFHRYETDPMAAAACRDLAALSSARALNPRGAVTPETPFRGDTPGDLVGPYISQFLPGTCIATSASSRT
jgi:hypothetical protein